MLIIINVLNKGETMNKLTKLLFSVISSVAIATSAFAGDFAVTGGVKATYTVLGNSEQLVLTELVKDLVYLTSSHYQLQENLITV